MPRTLSLVLALLTGCGASQATTPSSSEASPPSSSPRDDLTLEDRMWRHFHDATDALDAVISGDLEAVRPPLRKLATRDFGEALPADWMPWVEEMQAEARVGAEAADLDAAARSVAALGTKCAECHRATRGGAEFTGDETGYQHMRNTSLSEKMARHLWSAKELWLGMTGPVHQSWSQGAAALMNIEVPSLVDHRGKPVGEDKPPTGEGTLEGESSPSGTATAKDDSTPPRTPGGSVDLDAALEGLRALGARADKASAPPEKQEVFAAIVSRCAACHSELGIKPAVAQ